MSSRSYRDSFSRRTRCRFDDLNRAKMRYFSSYRTEREYSKNIWGISPLPVSIEEVGAGKRIKADILTLVCSLTKGEVG